MAKQPAGRLFSMLGTVLFGDIGPVTYYRNKNRKIVAFQKTFPKEPPSAEQVAQRQIFRDAAAAWRALTPEQKAQWKLASRRASLRMHGYDLFVHWQIKGDDPNIAAVERQTSTNLLPP